MGIVTATYRLLPLDWLRPQADRRDLFSVTMGFIAPAFRWGYRGPQTQLVRPPSHNQWMARVLNLGLSDTKDPPLHCCVCVQVCTHKRLCMRMIRKVSESKWWVTDRQHSSQLSCPPGSSHISQGGGFGRTACFRMTIGIVFWKLSFQGSNLINSID